MDQAKLPKALEQENGLLKRLVAEAELHEVVQRGGHLGKLLSPVKRRKAVEHVRDSLGRAEVSQRRACRVLVQSRATQKRAARVPDDEPKLVRRVTELAGEYGRYGYRRVALRSGRRASR